MEDHVPGTEEPPPVAPDGGADGVAPPLPEAEPAPDSAVEPEEDPNIRPLGVVATAVVDVFLERAQKMGVSLDFAGEYDEKFCGRPRFVTTDDGELEIMEHDKLLKNGESHMRNIAVARRAQGHLLLTPKRNTSEQPKVTIEQPSAGGRRATRGTASVTYTLMEKILVPIRYDYRNDKGIDMRAGGRIEDCHLATIIGIEVSLPRLQSEPAAADAFGPLVTPPRHELEGGPTVVLFLSSPMLDEEERNKEIEQSEHFKVWTKGPWFCMVRALIPAGVLASMHRLQA